MHFMFQFCHVQILVKYKDTSSDVLFGKNMPYHGSTQSTEKFIIKFAMLELFI